MSIFPINKLFAIILIFTLFLSFSFAGELSEKHSAEVGKLIDHYVANEEFVGAVLVVDRGDSIYKNVFSGNSEEELVTTDTPFFIGTLSKAFTALAVMILHDQGKLDFDASISEYCPKLDFYEEVTVRHLLNNISGTPDYFKDNGINWKEKLSTKNIEKFLNHERYFNYEPGRRMSPNNTEYLVLARIVEKVSGMKYGSFLRQNIFEPLGMTNTFSSDEKGALKKIKKLGDCPEKLELTTGIKCIFSSINDLEKWNKALDTNSLVETSTMAEAYTRGKLNNGRKSPMGFGWLVAEAKESLNVGCSSKDGNYRTFMEKMVEYDNSTIILCKNGADYIPDLSLNALLIVFNYDYKMVPDKKD